MAMINYGPDYGKLCVIMDVLDHNRVSCEPRFLHTRGGGRCRTDPGSPALWQTLFGSVGGGVGVGALDWVEWWAGVGWMGWDAVDDG